MPGHVVQALLTWVAVTAALAYWTRSLLRVRTPGVVPMVRVLAALDVALLLGLDLGLPNWAFGIATLPNFLVHVLALVAAYHLQVFVLHLAHDPAEVPRRAPLRGRLLAVALIALTTFYVLGPIDGDQPGIPAEAGTDPMITVYLAVFELYLGLAMADVAWASRHAKALARGPLRTGLQFLRWGGWTGLAFVVHKAAYSLAALLHIELPWRELGSAGISRALTTAAILLLMAGVTIPAVGGRRALRRLHTRLLPLWRDLTDFAPQSTAYRTFGSDITDKLRARCTQIQDVLVGPLQPHLDPAVREQALNLANPSQLDPDEANHAADAAVIAVALDTAAAAEAGHLSTPVTFAGPDTADYRAVADWLAGVSDAYTSSPIVATIRKEHARHAGSQPTG